jgi:hypothetical protein
MQQKRVDFAGEYRDKPPSVATAQGALSAAIAGSQL